MTLGRGCPGACKAFWKNCLAAVASRSAESQKSTVAPVESTARYRYRQFPPWRMYVSSTLQEPLVGFSSRRHLLFSSGGVALHPAPNGGVVSRETSFDEQFLDVPIRKREPQIPTDRANNDLGFEVPRLEQRWPRFDHGIYCSLSDWFTQFLQHCPSYHRLVQFYICHPVPCIPEAKCLIRPLLSRSQVAHFAREDRLCAPMERPTLGRR